MMAGKLKERKLEDDLQEAFRIFDQNGDGTIPHKTQDITDRAVISQLLQSFSDKITL